MKINYLDHEFDLLDGSPFQCGLSDALAGREVNPHYFDAGSTQRIPTYEMTVDQIAEYLAGRQYEIEIGDDLIKSLCDTFPSLT